MKYIYMLVFAFSITANAQIRLGNSSTVSNAKSSSAFLDASSSPQYQLNDNVGKGLLFPAVDLSQFTAFRGVPVGEFDDYPSFFDGMIVYNTHVGGTVGGGVTTAGKTDGELTRGYWYYDNPEIVGRNTTTGTWRSLSASGGDSNVIINEGTENITNIIIDGQPVYSYKGKFQMGAGSNSTAKVSLAGLPTGVINSKGVYKITIFQGTGSEKKYYANGAYSLDLASSTLVTGSPNISSRYPDGTYEYIIEYFKP